MSTPLSKNVVIFLLTSVGLIVLPHLVNISPDIFGFFSLMLIWRFVVIWRPQYLPSPKLLLLLTIFALVILFSHHRRIYGRDAGTSLFILALGLKLLEIKSERDVYLVTYLAFIVAASLFLYQQSLFMAAYILAVCCVLFATLIAINSVQFQTRVALKTAAMIILQALPMATIVFVLFPRIEAPRWMLFEEKAKVKMGLSDSMEPGSISELSLSTELVFRARFIGAVPPPNQRYWRGPVLSFTDGKRWTQLNSQRFQHQLEKPSYSGTEYSYTLLMEPQEKHWVYGLEFPAKFTEPLQQNGHYQLITRANPEKRAEYAITSYSQHNTGTINQIEYQDSIQLPKEPSVEIKQLVEQLQGFNAEPERFIQQLLSHFRTQDFYYTLTPPLMEENPIETFLFKTRSGFCSHYAAAFVYLMRVAHIPSRVVTGYQGGEYNELGNFLEIKQANAHAWAEVWIKNKGWIRVDPTAAIAPERIEQQINFEQLALGQVIKFNKNQRYAWLKQVGKLWDSVDYQWQHWVVNYDTDNQTDFLSHFGIHDLQTMLKWLMIFVVITSVVLGLLLLYQKKKTIDPVLRRYQQFCKKLQIAGLIRANHEGAVAFAERAKSALPAQAGTIEQITDAFIQLRYGKATTHQDFVRFSKLVNQFKLQHHPE